jgi:DNA-binding PadR family transcriptional regulator
MKNERRNMRDEQDGWRGRRGGGHGGLGRAGGGRGSGRRRMFDAGELRLVLLHLMEAQPRHGYDLIREIETRTGGVYTPSPGIVYPTLTMLEELEQIQATASEGSKRAFSLTALGAAHLAEHRGEAEAALARLDALRAEGRPIESGPVWRAMQNLKAVLEQRLTGTPDKQTLFDAADLIDEAARKIERLA